MVVILILNAGHTQIINNGVSSPDEPRSGSTTISFINSSSSSPLQVDPDSTYATTKEEVQMFTHSSASPLSQLPTMYPRDERPRVDKVLRVHMTVMVVM
uniref:Uncharacterized protein n=1 Tax=Timema genevievae TaxID=629358 RepID=A0A7R9JQT3_TIMGE|nr:unnamed protein product [Timema genevievae]